MRKMVWSALAMLTLIVAISSRQSNAAPQQDASPAELIEDGEKAFSVCAACHGARGGGGQGGGPALTRSPIATAADNGNTLWSFLKVGRPNKGMPAFPATSLHDAAAIAAFVRGIAGPGGTRTDKAIDPATFVVGDPTAGRRFFVGAGKCSGCHDPAGDMKVAAMRYDPKTLQNRMLLNRSRSLSLDEPATVTVRITWPDGRETTGPLLRISDFKVVYRDAAGAIQSVDRNGAVPTVVVLDKLKGHLDLIRTYRDEDIHNLTAYLWSLRS